MTPQLNIKLQILRGLLCCAGIAIGGSTIPAAAQTTRPDSASAQTESTEAKRTLPTPAEVTAAAAEEKKEEVVKLSPFTVYGEAEVGYQAKTTTAATRLRTNVDDVGTALQIVTTQFLKDTGVTNNQSLLTYTTGTEIYGPQGNFEGNGAGQTVYEMWGSLQRPDLNTRIRGLSVADNARDFELSDIQWDAYNIDTVEVQRGANAILFGLGSPGGLVNASLKQAAYRDSGEVVGRYGSYKSFRASLDVNHVLLPNELALRVDLLKEHQNFQQKPAFSNSKRGFLALRYDPAILNKGSSHTTLRVNYEKGDISAENPRTLPPVDGITGWFKTGTTTVGTTTYNNPNKGTWDYRYSNLYFADTPNSGFKSPGNPNYQPWLDTMYQGSYAYFTSPSATGPTGNYMQPAFYYIGQQHGIGPSGAIDGTIGGLVTNGMSIIAPAWTYANQSHLPFASSYKQTSLNDPTIFDFYHNLIEGPNRNEQQNFEAFNIHLSQTFLNNRIGFEAAYDKQRYRFDNYDPYYGSNLALNVDVNSVLQDGTANPNVGRPFILSASYYGGGSNQSLRENSRLTGFAELQATDVLKKSWLTDILGRHVFTGMMSYNDVRTANQAGAYATLNPPGAQADPDAIMGSGMDPFRWFKAVTYLGPNMSSLASASGLNLSRVQAYQTLNAPALRVFDSKWNKPTNPSAAGYVDPAAVWTNPLTRQASTQSENPDNYVGWVNLPVQTVLWNGDQNINANGASLAKQAVSSKVFVWQGFLFDGNIIPTIGYRRDTAKAYSATGGATTFGNINFSSPSYALPQGPFNTVKGTTKTYSVVGHLPKFIAKRLPWGLEFGAFINGSKDFQPSAGRVDILSVPLPAPSGRTKDYGFMVSALDGRLSLKVTKYQALSSASDSSIANMWLAGSQVVRAWVAASRYAWGIVGNPHYNPTVTVGPGWQYGNYVGGVWTQTAADIALQKASSDAILTGAGATFFENPVFWKAWLMDPTGQSGMSDYRISNNYNEPWTAGLGGYLPAGMTSLQDNKSNGYEYEIYARPVDNWDIALNVVKTKAGVSNIASGGANQAFLSTMNAILSGPGKDLRYSGNSPTNTIYNQWLQYIWNPLTISQALNGTNTAELRPWRVNLVTNYRFTKGPIEGVNVGVGYQWQDKVAIGYPSVVKNVNGTNLETVDPSSPRWGPTDSSVNLWAGYMLKITGKVTWHIQANVINALGKNTLIPINMQPDGSIASYRIKFGPTWTVTNTLSF